MLRVFSGVRGANIHININNCLVLTINVMKRAFSLYINKINSEDDKIQSSVCSYLSKEIFHFNLNSIHFTLSVARCSNVSCLFQNSNKQLNRFLVGKQNLSNSK